MEQTATEIKRLQGCINNLVSILALPARWSSHEVPQIVSTLLDGLVGLLRLDFVYVRVSNAIDGSPIQAVRAARPHNQAAQPQEVGWALNRGLKGDLSSTPLLMPNPVGEGQVSAVPFRLGLQEDVGVLIAGSQREDFPTEIEILLLRVVANQAAMGLQEARLLSEQRRAAEKLEHRVVERTRQLAAVNEELRKEIIERGRAEEALQQAQAELARVTRVLTLGEMTASIAHEINQPLAAVVTNASAGLRWLAGQTPNPEEARLALRRIINDGNRASEIIGRIRALTKKTAPRQDRLDLNEIVLEVIALARGELHRNRVSLQTRLSQDLPPVLGDRVQLQQVILNLIVNGTEAMSGVSEGARKLLVSSGRDEADGVLVAVRDCGVGLDEQTRDHLFEAFFTTKPEGMGMGLSISRSIITAHGGRLWAAPNADRGVTFQFMLPANSKITL